ncbi:MAG TPA: GspE/PulE family protein [Tepidisphaeraceae bacterium]|nr:GspE/PulE family protein [Tepidisphaeraceae bacterium]
MKTASRQPLGQLLIGRGFVRGPQLDLALDEQRRSNHQKLLGEILVDRQICSQEQVAEALADADGIPFARISPRLADPQVVAILPRDFLFTNGVLPLFLVENTLTLAMAEPSNLFLAEQIERRTGFAVQIVAATIAEIRATLEAYLPEEKTFVVDRISTKPADGSMKLIDAFPTPMNESAIEPAIDKLVDYCIQNAVVESAGEVHVEPGDEMLRIRYRIDGRLVEKLRPPARLHAALVAKIKQLAGLDAAQLRLPQEGQLRLAVSERRLTIHISTIPGRFGEKLVLRLSDDDRTPLKLEKLGFSYEMLKQWRRLIALPSGLVIVAGPSGSGKRATLYSALQERNSAELNLCTVEDRVEQTLPGINQFQVDLAGGFTFPAMLRAVLKQEPDMLAISDLPDAQAARAAAQAALGGLLVLGAMYASDAPAALSRLIHLGVEPHLLGSAISGVLARRVVRKLCPHCRQAYEASSVERRQLEKLSPAAGPLTLYRAQGCDRCRGLGYAGRIGVHELLVIDDALRDGVSRGISLADLRTMAGASGMKPLRADAFEKARAGLTTLDEVFRVTT